MNTASQSHARLVFRVAPHYQPMMRQIGLDAETIFKHPDIVVWRKLADRENCTLDATLADGRTVRLHIKRYAPTSSATTPADMEAAGHQMLVEKNIPTFALAGWGRLPDGRSFIITEDLAGYEAADKLIEKGIAFDQLLKPTAALAAQLHCAGLHHRDLYLCHFFARIDHQNIDVRLIDVARVRRLPQWPLKNRWIVKDLSQFWYSMVNLPITDQQRRTWLEFYTQSLCKRRGDKHTSNIEVSLSSSRIMGFGGRVNFLISLLPGLYGLHHLQREVERKARRIARHDVKLKRNQPNRNISIPES